MPSESETKEETAQHTNAGRTSGASSKLDAMSREDLLRIVKKQLVHLRLAKEQIEALKADEERNHARIGGFTATLSEPPPPHNQSSESSDHGGEAKKDQDLSGTMISMELADYKQSAEKLRSELKEVKLESERKEGLIGELSERLSSISQEREVAQETVRQNSGELSRLRSMLEEKSKVITENSKEINALVAQISQMRAEMEQEIGSLKETVLRQRQQLTMGASKDTSRASEMRRLASENDALCNELSELRTEHERFKERAEYVLKQREARVEELKTAASQLRPSGEKELHHEQVKVKQGKFEQLHAKYSVLEEELMGARQQISLLRAELDDSQRDFAIARQKWENDRSAIASKLQQQIKHLETTVADQRRELDDARDANEESRLRRERLAEQRIEELSRENAALRASEESLRRELEANTNGPIGAGEPAIQKRRPAVATLPTPLDIIGSTARDRPRTLLKNTNGSASAVNGGLSGRGQGQGADSDDDDNYLENLIFNDALSVDGDSMAGRRSTTLALPINHFGSSSRWEEGPSLDELHELHQSSVAQLEHTRELLMETEETNAKLLDQVKLLKEEIRRMERNHGRVPHINNSSEYLKNVMLKFLAPEQVSDQRYQLLSVLATMLKLSPEELNAVRQSIANGGPHPQLETTPGTTQADAGWSNYFGLFLS